jgi:hypothetical protein
MAQGGRGSTRSLGTSQLKKKHVWGGAHLRLGKTVIFRSNFGETARRRSSGAMEGIVIEGGRWCAVLLRGRESEGEKEEGVCSMAAKLKWERKCVCVGGGPVRGAKGES